MNAAFSALTTPTINSRQLATLEARLESNPFTSSVVDGRDLQSFDSQAARQGAVRVSDLPGIGPLNGLYRDLLRPQAAGSRLAPAIMSFGRHIPGLGHYGPRDLPRRA